MLRLLVKESIELYGNAFAVYNVHSLLHIHEDALPYGSLDNCYYLSLKITYIS